jgi:hypothetical protein
MNNNTAGLGPVSAQTPPTMESRRRRLIGALFLASAALISLIVVVALLSSPDREVSAFFLFLLAWLGFTIAIRQWGVIRGLRQAETFANYPSLANENSWQRFAFEKVLSEIFWKGLQLKGNAKFAWVIYGLILFSCVLFTNAKLGFDHFLPDDFPPKWPIYWRLTSWLFAIPFPFYLLGIPLFLGGQYHGFTARLSTTPGNLLQQARDYVHQAREAANQEKLRQAQEIEAAGKAAREAHRQKQQQWLQEAGANLSQAVRGGTEGAGRLIQGGLNAASARPPLAVRVDPDAGLLLVSNRYFRTADIIEATMIQSRPDGMAGEIASAVGASALGPLGYILGRAAGGSGVLDRRRLGLRLVLNDEHEPIRFLEITPDPLPITSDAFRTTKAELEKAVAQLQVLRLRRSGDLSKP